MNLDSHAALAFNYHLGKKRFSTHIFYGGSYKPSIHTMGGFLGVFCCNHLKERFNLGLFSILSWPSQTSSSSEPKPGAGKNAFKCCHDNECQRIELKETHGKSKTFLTYKKEICLI